MYYSSWINQLPCYCIVNVQLNRGKIACGIYKTLYQSCHFYKVSFLRVELTPTAREGGSHYLFVDTKRLDKLANRQKPVYSRGSGILW